MLRIALLALALPLVAQAQTPKDTGKGTVPAEAARSLGPAVMLPDTLRPGDLDLSALPEGETTYTVRLLAPMQQDIGSISETVSAEGGVLTRTSVVAIPMAGQNERATAEIDAGTYAFRTMEMDGSMSAGSLRLENGRIVGERQVGEQPGALPDPVAVDDVPDGPVFGSGWAFVVLPALPLSEGATHHVMTYSGRDGLVTERVTVLAPETLKPGGGAAVTLVPVETFDGETTMVYYVDPETRQVELVRFSPQAGVEVEFDRD